jgi:hypothetical protein
MKKRVLALHFTAELEREYESILLSVSKETREKEGGWTDEETARREREGETKTNNWTVHSFAEQLGIE